MSETEKLIELVRGRRLLYDLSDSDYKNRDKKTEAWLEIAKEMGTGDRKHWSKKWKNLKDNYKKFQKNAKGHSGQEYKKYKHWPWAEPMRFLDEFVRTTETNTTGDPEPEDLAESSIKGDLNPEHGELVVQEAPFQTSTPCRKKKRQAEDFEDPSDKILEYLKKKSEQKQHKTVDEVDHFFLSYAQSFKKFPPRMQAMLKLDIATLFARYELQAAGETINIPQQLPSSSDHFTNRPTTSRDYSC